LPWPLGELFPRSRPKRASIRWADPRSPRLAGRHKLQDALGLLLDVDQTGRGQQVDERMTIEHAQPDYPGTPGHRAPDGRLPGVARQYRTSAPRPQHPHHFAGNPKRLRHQIKGAETTDGVECFIDERQRACVAADVAGAWSAVVQHGALEHRLGDVQPDRKAAAGELLRQSAGEIAWAASDIEQPMRTGQT